MDFKGSDDTKGREKRREGGFPHSRRYHQNIKEENGGTSWEKSKALVFWWRDEGGKVSWVLSGTLDTRQLGASKDMSQVAIRKRKKENVHNLNQRER